MKKLSYCLFTLLILSACTDQKKEENALKNEVLDLHEKVMAEDEKAMVNKMKLDTLLIKADSLSINKQTARTLDANLNDVANKMGDWMRKLNLDNAGKSHDDIMNYWKQQKVQVKHIDSLYVNAITESDNYIKKSIKK